MELQKKNNKIKVDITEALRKIYPDESIEDGQFVTIKRMNKLERQYASVYSAETQTEEELREKVKIINDTEYADSKEAREKAIELIEKKVYFSDKEEKIRIFKALETYNRFIVETCLDPDNHSFTADGNKIKLTYDLIVEMDDEEASLINCIIAAISQEAFGKKS